jgi:hypothetical protein
MKVNLITKFYKLYFLTYRIIILGIEQFYYIRVCEIRIIDVICVK